MNKKSLDSINTLDQLQKSINLAIEEASQNEIFIINYFHAIHPYGAKREARYPVYMGVDKEYFPFDRTTKFHFDKRYKLYADFEYFSLGTELLNNEGDLLLRAPTKILLDSVEHLKREADNIFLPKQIHQNLKSTLSKLQAKISGSNPVEEFYKYGEWGEDDKLPVGYYRQKMLTEKIPLLVLKSALDSYIDLAKDQISRYNIDRCFEAEITYSRGKLERLKLHVPIKYFPISMLTDVGGSSGNYYGFDSLTLVSDLIGLIVFSSLPFSKRHILLSEEIPQNTRKVIFEYVDRITPKPLQPRNDKKVKATKKLLRELKKHI